MQTLPCKLQPLPNKHTYSPAQCSRTCMPTCPHAHMLTCTHEVGPYHTQLCNTAMPITQPIMPPPRNASPTKPPHALPRKPYHARPIPCTTMQTLRCKHYSASTTMQAPEVCERTCTSTRAPPRNARKLFAAKSNALLFQVARTARAMPEFEHYNARPTMHYHANTTLQTLQCKHHHARNNMHTHATTMHTQSCTAAAPASAPACTQQQQRPPPPSRQQNQRTLALANGSNNSQKNLNSRITSPPYGSNNSQQNLNRRITSPPSPAAAPACRSSSSSSHNRSSNINSPNPAAAASPHAPSSPFPSSRLRIVLSTVVECSPAAERAASSDLTIAHEGFHRTPRDLPFATQKRRSGLRNGARHTKKTDRQSETSGKSEKVQ